MALLGQPLQTPRDHLVPKQWENFSPLLGHHSGGSWSSSPFPQSLQSSLARCEWGRDPQGHAHPARERGPDALISWLPSRCLPAPLRTPGSSPRSQPSRRGDRGPCSGGGRRKELRLHWQVASACLPDHKVGWWICGKPAREPRGGNPGAGALLRALLHLGGSFEGRREHSQGFSSAASAGEGISSKGRPAASLLPGIAALCHLP